MNTNSQVAEAAGAPPESGRRGLPSEFTVESIKSVRKIATMAAHRFGLPKDFIDDIVGDVTMNWFCATTREDLDPVRDAEAWLFVAAKNSASKFRSKSSRFAPLAEAGEPFVPFGIGSFDPTTPPFDPTTFIQGLERLHAIVHFAMFRQTVDDRQVFERRIAGLKFDQIAADLNMSPAAVRQRWYRLLNGLADGIFEEAKKDSALAAALPSILKNIDVFHRSVLAFMNAISHGGFTAVKKAAEFVLNG
jgi:DNA-directed RNA polymerase specialized sigma24 family protein